MFTLHNLMYIAIGYLNICVTIFLYELVWNPLVLGRILNFFPFVVKDY